MRKNTCGEESIQFGQLTKHAGHVSQNCILLGHLRTDTSLWQAAGWQLVVISIATSNPLLWEQPPVIWPLTKILFSNKCKSLSWNSYLLQIDTGILSPQVYGQSFASDVLVSNCSVHFTPLVESNWERKVLCSWMPAYQNNLAPEGS